MSETNKHPWCRDVSRDEAIRAAEDDAANWRRLEVGEVVQEGDEYLNPNGGWYAVLRPHVGRRVTVEKGNYRRRRVPLPDHRELPAAVAELRERVAKIEEAMLSGSTWFPKSDKPAPPPPPSPPQPAPVPPADGLRTERVTLEVTHNCAYPAAEWVLEVVEEACTDPGESVRVVEDATIGSGDVFRDVGCGTTGDEIVRLTAERDAARAEAEKATAMAKGLEEKRAYFKRERDVAAQERERLRARVAELESAAKLAPAANAGGERK